MRQYSPHTLCIILLLCGLACLSNGNETSQAGQDFYSFSAEDIHGNHVSFEKYRGKVSMVVNVASECGYTDVHYRGLVLLQQTFGHTDKFNVLAFPCNQFGEQEPGNHEEIYHFAHDQMGANFPLFAKVNVRNNDIHPAWVYLSKSQLPTWNFFKYLVDHNGRVINVWGPHVDPEDLRQEVQKAVLAIGHGNLSGSDGKNRDEF